MGLNDVRWQGKRHRGFYEVWYVTLVDPASGDAYWFRYTIDAPAAGKGESELGLWAFSTPAKDPRAGLSLHDRLPLSKFADKTTEEKGFRVEFGKAFVDPARATGKTGSGERSIEWDLKWEKNGVSFEHVPMVLEKLGVAQSAASSQNLAVLFDGTIKVGGKSIKVSKWPGEQSHTWGKKHADSWAWAHCNAFEEDKDAVFEGVSARVRKLGLLLPAATPLFLRLAGTPEPREISWTSVFTLWSNVSRVSAGRWDFEADSPEVLLKGTASAPLERMIAVEYRDPDGEPLWCHHATGGDLALEVYRRTGARWSLDRRLTSKGTTAFELTSRARDPEVGRYFDLSQAIATEGFAPPPVAVASAS
ncbi:hypothetical protein HY251_11595 [bacterium]|nr:hypothetical protein [bacterium]